VNGEIVGFYQINRSERPWTLEHLWVRPEAAGHGIGTALLRDAAARVAVAGGDALAIDCSPFDQPVMSD
jgi:GNAT superfamily N-acetyltransferase